MAANVKDYSNLLTHYFRRSPELVAYVESCVKPFVDIINMVEEYQTKLDLKTAEGVYLDIIGKKLGYSREVDFTPASGGTSLLNDTQYRRILEGRQLFPLWDGTTSGFEELFTQSGIDNSQVWGVDNGDMTVTYGYMGETSDLEVEVMVKGNYFPHTAGVGFSVIVVDELIAGFAGQGQSTYDQAPYTPDRFIS